MLFDITDTSDLGFPQDGEPVYAYMRRSAMPEIVRIRGMLEAWFEDYPISARNDLRARFRESAQQVHQGAYFELLVHALLKKLGYIAEAHPIIPDSSGRPDFLARWEGRPVYVECTVIDRDAREKAATAAEQDVLNKLNSLVSAYYRLTISMSGRLTDTLSRKCITGPFDQWLKTNSPPKYPPSWPDGDPESEPVRIEHGDWELVGEFVRMDVAKSNLPYPAIENPFIIMRSTDSRGGTPDIYGRLKGKAKSYKNDLPLVIAISTSCDHLPHGALYEEQALFGTGHIRNPNNEFMESHKRPGLWVDASGEPARKNVAAVLVFKDASVYRMKAQSSRLYINPWGVGAQLPCPLFKLPYTTVVDNEVRRGGDISVTDILATKEGSHLPGDSIWDDTLFPSR